MISAGYCDVIKWIDRDYQKYAEKEMAVSPMQDIQDSEVEYSIIAVKSPELYLNIYSTLEQNGRAKRKKIVGPIQTQ